MLVFLANRTAERMYVDIPCVLQDERGESTI